MERAAFTGMNLEQALDNGLLCLVWGFGLFFVAGKPGTKSMTGLPKTL